MVGPSKGSALARQMGVFVCENATKSMRRTDTICLLLWASAIQSQRQRGEKKRKSTWMLRQLVNCFCWGLRHPNPIKSPLVDKLTDVRTKRTNGLKEISHTHTFRHSHLACTEYTHGWHMRHASADALNKLDRQCRRRRLVRLGRGRCRSFYESGSVVRMYSVHSARCKTAEQTVSNSICLPNGGKGR